MSLSKYIARLNNIPFNEVTGGLTTIHIFSENEIEENQLGYSVDSEGNSLTGTAEGDWKKNWFVIGYEDLCGDPIFIDLDAKFFPVFTAIHGIGDWKENLIADSFDSFVESLEFLRKATSKVETLKEIKRLNPKSDTEFWELLFEED